MRQLLISIAVGMILGVVAGFVIGWGVAPVRYVGSMLGQLARPYQDEYTVMVATTYRQDGDLDKALERLRPLGHENIPEWVRDVTERYISNGRSVADIIDLVALYEALGPLPPSMQRFRLPPTPVIPGED